MLPLLHFKLFVLPTHALGHHKRSCYGKDNRHWGHTEHEEPKSKENNKVIIRSCSLKFLKPHTHISIVFFCIFHVFIERGTIACPAMITKRCSVIAAATTHASFIPLLICLYLYKKPQMRLGIDEEYSMDSQGERKW